MNGPPTSADAASLSGGVGNFGVLERKRQAVFREGLTTPSDGIGQRHDYLLALGCEEENLFPTLRGDDGAGRYFADRNIKWWQASVSGDASDGKRPTRNMASSQIACVNFLLPLIDIPGGVDRRAAGPGRRRHGRRGHCTREDIFTGRAGVDRARPRPGGSLGEEPRCELDQRRRVHGCGDAQRGDGRT